MTNHTELVGERVVLTTTEGVKHEGTLEIVNEMGAVLKLKNSSKSHMEEAKNIASIEPVKAMSKKLKPRSLPEVNKGKFRQHLLDRHGYSLADIEAMSEDEAEAFHATIDHAPLGHFHRTPAPVEAEIEAAESDES